MTTQHATVDTSNQPAQTNNSPKKISLGNLDELISDINGDNSSFKNDSHLQKCDLNLVNIDANITKSNGSLGKPEDDSPSNMELRRNMDLHKNMDFNFTGMKLEDFAPYNPNDSAEQQCKTLHKITTQMITEMSARMLKLQENQQMLVNIIKNLEKTSEKANAKPLIMQSGQTGEKIKQIFTNQKNYDKPDITSLDLSPQAILELYNMHAENTIEELVKMIWFNKNIPQNYSIFLLNSSTDEILCYKDGWRKDKFKNILAALLNFLDNLIGIGFTNHVTINAAAFSIQAKRAREQFMHARQSFKNPVVVKGAIPPYIAVYYERIKDLAETMTEETLRGKLL